MERAQALTGDRTAGRWGWRRAVQGGAMTLLLFVVGCAEPWPGQGLVGYPQLAEEVRRHYERDAMERSATCVRPLMTGILRAEIVERDDEADEMTVLVRYAWRDGLSDDDPPFVGCNGIAERRFLVDTSGEIARVIGMDGEQRPRRR